MNEREARDPFSLTADTALYVARPVSERALDALLAAVEEGGLKLRPVPLLKMLTKSTRGNILSSNPFRPRPFHIRAAWPAQEAQPYCRQEM